MDAFASEADFLGTLRSKMFFADRNILTVAIYGLQYSAMLQPFADPYNCESHT